MIVTNTCGNRGYQPLPTYLRLNNDKNQQNIEMTFCPPVFYNPIKGIIWHVCIDMYYISHDR